MSKIKPIELIQNFKNNRKSDTVFLIGGGPSLLKYLPDHSVLNGKDIIATNNAYKIFPNAFLTIFADKVWYGWHRDKIHKAFTNPIVTLAKHHLEEWKLTPVYCFNKGPAKGLSTYGDTINGNNAGHNAINLATLIGYKTIILLGYDMDKRSKQTHWHNEHLRHTTGMLYKEGMIPGMDSIVPLQEKLGFKIWNINRESIITGFSFADLKDFL